MVDTLVETRDGPIVRLDLNRPEVHNAFDGDLLDALLATFEALAADDSARVIVLGGRGRSWCAGADLRWMKSAAGRERGVGGLAQLLALVSGSPKPVIARVHGAVRGGGTGLLAACDMAVALESVNLAFSEVRLGLAPAVISPYVVAKIGVPAARELFLTGARFSAARARELQLVSRVAADVDALDAEIDALAQGVAKGGPRAVAACKELATTVTRLPADEVGAYTAGLIATLRASEEGQEGMAAFLGKRPPAWMAKG